jgi:putative FmdB family regulatory protein
MPLYEFFCEHHGVCEVLMKHSELDTVEVVCEDCGTVMTRKVSMPAKTASLWSGGWRKGLASDGFFSPSVGARVGSKREEEKIMNARGYIREADLGGESFFDSQTSKAHAERDKHEKTAARYRENLEAFGGDKLKAVEHTFPAQEMLAQSEKITHAKDV